MFMRKTKLLLAALAFGTMTANADVMLETDLTSSFNSLATTQWTGSSGQVGWAAPKVTTNSGLEVAAWESYCGDWNGGCTNTGTIMKTTVTGLASGTYKIELYGAAAFTFNRGFGSAAFTGDPSVGGKATSDTYTAGQSINTETGVVLYATTSEGTYSEEIPIWYADNFNGSGLSTAVLNDVVVGSDGQIEIGMSKTSMSTNWHVVQLKGVTATVSGDAAISALKAAATALLADAKYTNVTGTERTNLAAAAAATPSENTVAAYQKVIGDLNTAISAFEGCDYAAYDAYVAYKAETAALFGDEVANSVSAPATAAEAATAIQNLNIAQYNKTATDYKYSCTGLIGDFGSWDVTATVEGNPGSSSYKSNEHWSGETHAYYEQDGNGWSKNAWTIQYQQTCTLPAGQYVLKVAARASGDVTGTLSCSATATKVALPNVGAESKGIDKTGAASWTGDNFAKDGKGYGWQWRFLPFTVSEAGSVTLTVYAETGVNHNWVSLADGELLSANDIATAVAYNEATNNGIADEAIANVTSTRNIKVGYNTVVLPFDATANQVAAAFGTGTEVYAYSEESADPNAATVSFTKGDGSITANVPVLIKATEASATQEFKGVKVVAAEAKVAGTNFDFVGTYAPIDAIATGDYFIGNGAIYKSAGATSINAFRAYIKATSAGACIANFYIDGVETTAIETLAITGAKTNGKIYNLNGQEVKSAQKGIYIMNGKKFVIK